MDITIRHAALSDLPYIHDICRLTGKSGKDATNFISDNYIAGQYFAAPYLHFELDACFVLDNGSVPVGYVIGTSSTLTFNAWMNGSWLPAIRKYYGPGFTPKSDFEQFLYTVIHRDCELPEYLAYYPGHLHIDLLPEAQNKGFGKKLISRFLDAMKQKGINAIHLGVGLGNTNAIGFYKRFGFFEIKEDSGTLFMGYRLRPE